MMNVATWNAVGMYLFIFLTALEMT